MSAYVSQALETYDERDGLTRYLDELDEKYGPPEPEATAWADGVMREVGELRQHGGYPPR